VCDQRAWRQGHPGNPKGHCRKADHTRKRTPDHEGTDTLPVNYHCEVRPRPTSRTATTCAVARRAERTAARPLPGPESPASLAQCSREHATSLGRTIKAFSAEEPTQPPHSPATQPGRAPVSPVEWSTPRRIATTQTDSPREGANKTTAKSTLLQTQTAKKDSRGGTKRTSRTLQTPNLYRHDNGCLPPGEFFITTVFLPRGNNAQKSDEFYP
jgi:hypothetical protein